MMVAELRYPLVYREPREREFPGFFVSVGLSKSCGDVLDEGQLSVRNGSNRGTVRTAPVRPGPRRNDLRTLGLSVYRGSWFTLQLVLAALVGLSTETRMRKFIFELIPSSSTAAVTRHSG